MPVIVGVDPGLDGGIAVLSDDGLALHVMPTCAAGSKRQLDERALVELLTEPAIRKARVVIEAVAARPGQGVVSMFSFGTGWGQVRGICAGLGLPYVLVRPQEWQREVLMGMPERSEYAVASRLWPSADWRASERCSKAHSGLVDAALLVEYGRRKGL